MFFKNLGWSSRTGMVPKSLEQSPGSQDGTQGGRYQWMVPRSLARSPRLGLVPKAWDSSLRHKIPKRGTTGGPQETKMQGSILGWFLRPETKIWNGPQDLRGPP